MPLGLSGSLPRRAPPAGVCRREGSPAGGIHAQSKGSSRNCPTRRHDFAGFGVWRGTPSAGTVCLQGPAGGPAGNSSQGSSAAAKAIAKPGAWGTEARGAKARRPAAGRPLGSRRRPRFDKVKRVAGQVSGAAGATRGVVWPEEERRFPAVGHGCRDVSRHSRANTSHGSGCHGAGCRM